jgi:hypothetical protein
MFPLSVFCFLLFLKQNRPIPQQDQAANKSKNKVGSRLSLSVLQVAHLAHLALGGVLFAFANFARFFKALTSADFRHQAAFLAALGKAPECPVEGFAFANFDEWQSEYTSFQAVLRYQILKAYKYKQKLRQSQAILQNQNSVL